MLVAAPGRQIVKDRLDHLFGYRMCRGDGDAPSSRLAVDADAHLEFRLTEFEVRLARGRTVQDVKATPMERVRRFTVWPRACSSKRFIPFSAAAPTIFSTINVPATSRRPVE